MLQALCLSVVKVPNVICATCLSKNRMLHSLQVLPQLLSICNAITGITLSMQDNICWECKAQLLKMLKFKEKAVRSHCMLRSLSQLMQDPRSGQEGGIVESLSTLSQLEPLYYEIGFSNPAQEQTTQFLVEPTEEMMAAKTEFTEEYDESQSVPRPLKLDQDFDYEGIGLDTQAKDDVEGVTLNTIDEEQKYDESESVPCRLKLDPHFDNECSGLETQEKDDVEGSTLNAIDEEQNNTQDYLDIGETVVAAPVVATTLGFIKEEHIDPDDAEILAHTEKIRDLINEKIEVKQESHNFLKTDEQIIAGPSIILKAEDLAVDSITGSVIDEKPSASSELNLLKEQVASWRVILYRLPTDTLLPSTTTSAGGPVAVAGNAKYYKFIKSTEVVPQIEEATNAATETECDYLCSNSSSLKKHIKTHTDDNLFKCDMCDFTTSQLTNMNIHMITHRGKKPYKCNTCGFASSRLDGLKIHMRTHTGEKAYLIRHSHLSNLNKHMRKHTGVTSYKCNTCDYACSRSSHLKTHMRTHTGEKPYKCNTCDHASSHLCNLKNHMRTHTGEKPYKCNTCDYATSYLCNLNNHMRTHTGEKPYKCNTCDYAFSRSSHLKTHMRTHTDEKPYKCNTCDYACSNSRSLQNHMRTHTGEKPYKCNTCDYACSESGGLKRHIRMHTGERPYKCNTCNYASSYLSNLKMHMRTHTGERTYKCNTCDYASSLSSTLKNHMRTHSGEKPYKCKTCDYASSHLSTLKKHIRTHTVEQPFLLLFPNRL